MCLLTGFSPLSWLKPVISVIFFFYSAEYLEENRIAWKSSVNVNPFLRLLWKEFMGNSSVEYRDPKASVFDCRFILLLLKVCQVCYSFSHLFLIIIGKYKRFCISVSLVNCKKPNKVNNPGKTPNKQNLNQAVQCFSLEEVQLCLNTRHRKLI